MLPRIVLVVTMVALLATSGTGRVEGVGKVYRLGYLSLWYSTSDPVQRLALSEALRGRGYLEGERIVFESRYADGKIERLPDLAAELVRLRVDVIVAVSTPAGIAAKHATSAIPTCPRTSRSSAPSSGRRPPPRRPSSSCPCAPISITGWPSRASWTRAPRGSSWLRA